jgi:cellulose synthase/poly-beta-1,6-N-acetylglucosamine synthase-like glycosyltransferase
MQDPPVFNTMPEVFEHVILQRRRFFKLSSAAFFFRRCQINTDRKVLSSLMIFSAETVPSAQFLCKKDPASNLSSRYSAACRAVISA